MPALDQINQGGTIYEIVPEIAELFKTTKAYHTGDHVIYEAGWYTFKADKSAGAWDATKVDGPFKVTEQISNLKEDLNAVKSEVYDVVEVTYTADDVGIRTLNTSNGQPNSSSKRLATNSAVYLTEGSTVSCSIKFAVYQYSDESADTENYIGVTHSLALDSDVYNIPADNWYKILLAYSDDSTITSDDIDDLLATLTVMSVVPKDNMHKSDGVGYFAQDATDAQKAVARGNIDAVGNGYAQITLSRYMFAKIGLSPSNGSSTGSKTNRLTSAFIYLHKGSKVQIAGSKTFFVFVFGGDRTYNASGYVSEITSYTVKADGFYRFTIRKTDDSAIADGDIVTMIADLTIMDCRNPAILPTQTQLILPDLVPVAGGRQFDVNYQNVIYGYKTPLAQRILMDSNAFANHNGFARWTPTGTSTGSASTNYLDLYANNPIAFDTAKAFSILRIGTNAGNGLTKKVMMIGDSLTGGYSGIRTELVSLFADDPMSIELVGTLGDAPYKHEGRSGWGVYTYYHNQTKNDNSIVNPYWNPSVEHFDFGYYMENSGVSAPDYVLICLGTNDTGRTDAEIKEAMDGIIESIREYSQTIKIGIWLPPVSATLQNENDGANLSYHVIKLYIDQYCGRQSELIYTIPVYMVIDTKHDYRTEEVDISARNSDYKLILPTDNIHPATCGFQKIADVLYSFIKYLGYLDT